MKIKNTFLLGILAVAGLSSCVSENIENEDAKTAKGRMALTVSLLKPAETRYTADELASMTKVTDYPVVVKDANGTVVNSYNTVADVPESVVLGIGDYTVESHTPGTLGAGTTTQYPYYEGSEVMTIETGITTNVDVVCKMKNGSVSVVYSDEFKNYYSDWTVTFDDNQGDEGTAYAFTQSMGDKLIYWNFGENVIDKLNLNFVGVNPNGKNVKDKKTLTKVAGTYQESYDDDNLYFGGGDAVVVNFGLKMDGHGTVTGITVTATSTLFGETTETVNLEVTDNPDQYEPGVDQGGGGGETPTVVPITLTIPNTITFTSGEGGSLDPSIGDVKIEAEKGLKSLMVTAESSNPDMVASLEAVGAGYGLDFVGAGVEVVGNNDLVAFFSGLGKTLAVPAEGDTEYNFPVGAFFSLLDVMSGTHTFHLTATDLEGNKKSGTLVIVVNE